METETERLVIVRRNHFAAFARLARAFAGEPHVRLIWDRRFGERRAASGIEPPAERRRGDRRGDQAAIWGRRTYLLLTLRNRETGATRVNASTTAAARRS